MKDLIERLQAATGPDRELDGLIQTALDLPPMHFGAGGRCNAFTRSLDAALLLVPEGWRWFVNWKAAHVWRVTDDGDVFLSERANAATPIIALCIAALQARAADAEG